MLPLPPYARFPVYQCVALASLNSPQLKALLDQLMLLRRCPAQYPYRATIAPAIAPAKNYLTAFILTADRPKSFVTTL